MAEVKPTPKRPRFDWLVNIYGETPKENQLNKYMRSMVCVLTLSV
jgi:hypothetical protein